MADEIYACRYVCEETAESERLASGDALPCGSSETEWTRCELWLLVEPYCVPATDFPI